MPTTLTKTVRVIATPLVRAMEANMLAQLEQGTDHDQPPSKQIAVWRSFERAFFDARDLHPSDRNAMDYNLYTDAAGLTHGAHKLLTDADYRELTGFTARHAPWRALGMLAKAFGYRYLRGLEAIRGGLGGAQLAAFDRDREAFRRGFEQFADAAHLMNKNGKHPGTALDAVEMFAAELLELVPWLDRVGNRTGAAALHESASPSNSGNLNRKAP